MYTGALLRGRGDTRCTPLLALARARTTHTAVDREARHLPSVAGDNSSGNVIPTPPPTLASAIHKKNISKMNFLGTTTQQALSPTRAHARTRAENAAGEILQNFNMIYPERCVIYLSLSPGFLSRIPYSLPPRRHDAVRVEIKLGIRRRDRLPVRRG